MDAIIFLPSGKSTPAVVPAVITSAVAPPELPVVRSLYSTTLPRTIPEKFTADDAPPSSVGNL